MFYLPRNFAGVQQPRSVTLEAGSSAVSILVQVTLFLVLLIDSCLFIGLGKPVCVPVGCRQVVGCKAVGAVVSRAQEIECCAARGPCCMQVLISCMHYQEGSEGRLAAHILRLQ